MLKWALTLGFLVVMLGLVSPRQAQRWRLGRLPGDLRYRWRGREFSFPFTTTLLLSLLLSLLLRVL